MAKKQHERVIPSGAEQKQMRQSVVERLDKLIINWDPKFVTSNETEILSSVFLTNLSNARNILENMFLPRNDIRVNDYYEVMLVGLESLEDAKTMSMLSGDIVISCAVDKILSAARQWENLQ